MITLPGYTIIAEIHAGKNTVIYRARRERDQTPVILKMPRLEQPTPKDVAQLRHEYEITKNLDMDGVVKMHGLETHQQRPILVLEDFGGQSLKNLIAAHPFDPATFLVIAIQLADTLGAVHQRQIIHKDIKPTNIIVDFGLEQIPGESKSKISKMPAKSPQGERVQNPLAYPPGQAKSKIQVKITDFGIASRLSRENPTISNPTMLEGTLAYISPEQTGRMNRAVDYRTDFYSLGVTFYEMLTGRLPFEADDPMALVHAHIAKQPLPPVALRQDVPPMVSNIIMKLLAKTAEERYQSASGLKADLERCLHQWQATGQIESFRLGRQDMSDRFELPQKLYGREQDIGTLLAVFGRVAREEQPGNGATRHLKSPTAKGYAVANLKSEIVLVAGSAGIGKSSLINEVHKAIAGVEQRGYFISGKFDQYKRNIPYASLIQAFQDLARQILTESDSQIAAWQEKLLAALGPNGQVIIDVIPEVELIIGPQPEVPSLPPAETQNRFNLVFQNFVNVFAGADQPLAIFLDDLQWADAASLKLIHLLVTNPASHRLFMIGAYRDNEVSSAHPLSLALNDLKEAGATINQITLKPLELVHINQLITHTLHCPADKAKPLAELVLSKTAGNPFFVNQFLRSLYDENLLTFIPPGGGSPPSFPPGGGDEGGGGWQWDIAQIQAQGITDNVVELMAGKIEKLAPATQHILKLAACIGNEFDLQTLTIVHEKPPAATAADLWPALQEGLILGISDLRFTVYDLEQESSIPNPQSPISNPQSPIPNPQFKFLHDRVQQAAYSLIADDQKQEVHLKIGQLLLKSTAAADLDDKIFDIVNQLNEGADLIENQAGRIELARLNLIAGKKAKAATAYESALRYLSTGVELLTPPIAHSQTPNDREAGQMTNDQPKI
jgi:serine/threonine protein kinase